MEIGGQPRLYIALHADGAVSRAGNGQPNEVPGELCLGQLDPSVFEELVRSMPDDFVGSAGIYQLPDPKGIPVRLVIDLKFSGLERTMEFLFGSVSVGIPEAVLVFVKRMRSETDPWYRTMSGR